MAATLEQLAAKVEALKQQVEIGRRALDELEIQKVQSLYSHYEAFFDFYSGFKPGSGVIIGFPVTGCSQ